MNDSFASSYWEILKIERKQRALLKHYAHFPDQKKVLILKYLVSDVCCTLFGYLNKYIAEDKKC